MADPRHFLTGEELAPDEIGRLLDRALELKAGRESGRGSDALAGKTVALFFERPSTRTRVSFQVGVMELGAHPLALRADELQLGRGESIAETARVLSRFVHGIVMRSGSDETVAELAPFQLNEALMAAASDRAIALHCLPAHPGEEITEDVLYGERSAVWDQAENRLHAQKALLERLVG